MSDTSKKIQATLIPLLRTTAKRVASSPQMLAEAGNILVSSITLNFKKGGRYKQAGSIEGGTRKWEPVSKRYALYKKSKGKNPLNVLRFSAQLEQSIRYEVRGTMLIVSTNKVYAPSHQLGLKITIPGFTREVKFKRVKKGGKTFIQFAKAKDTGKNTFTKKVKYKTRTFKMKERPFIVIQKEDIADIAAVFGRRFVLQK